MRIIEKIQNSPAFRHLINYLLVFAIIISFGNYAYEGFYAYRQYKTYSWLRENNQVIVYSNELKLHIKSVEASHRNFLITNNSQYSEAFRRNINQAYEVLEKIEVYTLDYTEYQEEVADLRLKTDEWFARLSTTIALRKTMNIDEIIETEKKSNCDLVLSDINILLDELIKKLNNADKNKAEEINHNLLFYISIRIPILVVIFGILIVAIYAIMIVRRSRRKLFDLLLKRNDEFLLNIGETEKRLSESEILFRLVENLKSSINFIKDIANGNYSATIKGMNEKNAHLNKKTLAGELLQMRNILLKAAKEDENRKKEDEKRNWATLGMAKMSELLRQNSTNLHLLADHVIKYVINYLNANQGGIYLLTTNENKNEVLKLEAAYAYDAKKHLVKEYLLGESLVGACAVERQRMIISEIPENYIHISSILGKTAPRNLLLVPLFVGEELVGVIELASFNTFENYQIEFIDNIAQSIASIMISTKINSRTTDLLIKSQEQAEALSAQEEELRQNLEELQATQEEAARKSAELEAVFDVIDETLGAVEFDTSRRITRANYFFVNKLSLKHHETVGKLHEELIEMCSVEVENFDNMWKQLNAGYTLTLKHSYSIEGNQSVWFRETYKPIFNNNGELQKILAIYIDITESKEQEIKLKRQTRQMLATQDELTKRMKELTDARSELEIQKTELEQKNMILFHKQEELKDALLSAKEAEMEVKSRNESLVKQEDMTRKNMEELLKNKISLEKQQAELQFANDKLQKVDNELKKQLQEIEKREKEIKRHNIELAQSEKLIYEILNKLPLSVFWKNTKLQYLGCNETFAHNAGFPSTESIISKTDFDMPWVQFADSNRNEDKEVLKTQKPKLNFQKEIVFANKTRKWINISKYPLFDINNKIYGVLGIFEDISEFKKKENEMQQVQKNIEKEIEKRLKDQMTNFK